MLDQKLENHPNKDAPHLLYKISLLDGANINGATEYIGSKIFAWIDDNQIFSTNKSKNPKPYYTSSRRGLPKLLKTGAVKYKITELMTSDNTKDVIDEEVKILGALSKNPVVWATYINMHIGTGFSVAGRIATDEERKQMSEISKEYWSNPEARKEQSERRKKHFEDNPEAREQTSEIRKKYWSNPEAREQQSERGKKYQEDNPEARKEQSERVKKYARENPEAVKRRGEAIRKGHARRKARLLAQKKEEGNGKPASWHGTQGMA